MKMFLLTWYGITDLRASLGFEKSDGPIAAALAAEAYTDIVILCYTRADNDSPECVETQRYFAAELAAIRASSLQNDWKTTGDFVSKFANTDAAHKHFIAWLKSRVEDVGSVKIWFKSEKLRELNDTEGIYACAMRALDLVAQETGEKLVTLYLSPGTPVMAFVWAFAALGHPGLKKRLIAAPVIGKPPAIISLPAEWLDRHGANQKATRDSSIGFDVTFHLFGEQRMPALLGIRQFESKRHIFVNSKEYPAKCMRAFIGGGGFEELTVDPWDASAVREQIVRRAEELPPNARIGANLTGGTKLMFAGALAAARALGAAPFYFDSRNRRVTFVDNFHSAPIRPIDSVETFLQLNGDGLKLSQSNLMAELSPDCNLLTETLWKHNGRIRNCYGTLRQFNESFKPFRVESSGFMFELKRNKVATVAGGGLDLRFENWPDFAKYLSGGWFEEYVYLKFKPYQDAGVIKDLCINVELQFDRNKAGKFNRWDNAYNELDVVFTDGYSLYIAECKAGNVTQEQVMKLQNLVRFYGGVEGRGIVACCFQPNTESVRKKIKDARLTLCCGETFSEQVKTLMDGISERAKSIEKRI